MVPRLALKLQLGTGTIHRFDLSHRQVHLARGAGLRADDLHNADGVPFLHPVPGELGWKPDGKARSVRHEEGASAEPGLVRWDPDLLPKGGLDRAPEGTEITRGTGERACVSRRW